MHEIIATADAPKAIGPYSQAVVANGFVFCSGQIPIDPHTQRIVEGTIAEQTDRVLKNLAAVLKAAGSSLDKVVRSTIFLQDIGQYPNVNAVYSHYFPFAPPARSTVEVTRLPKDVMVEIDAIASL